MVRLVNPFESTEPTVGRLRMCPRAESAEEPSLLPPPGPAAQLCAMDLAYFRTLLDYHYWARDRMLAAVAVLDHNQYAQPVGGSFGSVRETLNHLYGAEVLWLKRWQGESPSAFPSAMPDTLAALAQVWASQDAAMRAYLAPLQESDLQRVIAYRNLAGVAGESALWEMLAHVVNHATYHRGQVTTLLRLLGAPPPASTDLIAYYRQRGASAG